MINLLFSNRLITTIYNLSTNSASLFIDDLRICPDFYCRFNNGVYSTGTSYYKTLIIKHPDICCLKLLMDLLTKTYDFENL